MLRFIDHKKMGRGEHSWLTSIHHFSFANYYNPDNIQFGVLRVVNDDSVTPDMGFDTHPHKDMEIITYVVDGEITHADSMGNKGTLKRGEVQYMSAGTGVFHSEHNFGEKQLRFLQIWILPDAPNHKPNYGDYRFKWEDRQNKWLPIASYTKNKKSDAPIKIHADVNVYATYITKGNDITLKIGKNRQAYLVLIEGDADVNLTKLNAQDALEIVEEDITIKTKSFAHVIVFEMAESKNAQFQGE
ncbi:MAG: pirin family protein [Endomicrobia bacterium]|nr:pirin family protein [Endomicrobiia bacterium]MCL2506227.1 pirin family protein [Endomicrobiia bacterium]